MCVCVYKHGKNKLGNVFTVTKKKSINNNNKKKFSHLPLRPSVLCRVDFGQKIASSLTKLIKLF